MSVEYEAEYDCHVIRDAEGTILALMSESFVTACRNHPKLKEAFERAERDRRKL